MILPNTYLQFVDKKNAGIKRSQFKNLKVIGITGSYGKSSMKEYLDYFLSLKYKTLKTPNHINVDTGIAKLILDEFNRVSDFIAHRLLINFYNFRNSKEINLLDHSNKCAKQNLKGKTNEIS